MVNNMYTKEELRKLPKRDLQSYISWNLGPNVNVNQKKDTLIFIVETFIGVKEEETSNEKN